MLRIGRDRIPSWSQLDEDVLENNREALCADRFANRTASHSPAAKREWRLRLPWFCARPRGALLRRANAAKRGGQLKRASQPCPTERYTFVVSIFQTASRRSTGEGFLFVRP